MLKLGDNIVNHAKKTGQDVVVDYTVVKAGGWCGPTVKKLRAELAKNFKHSGMYVEYEYDGVKVFVQKNLKRNEDMYIEIKKTLLVFRQWVIEGIRI